jgi:hypothetical protein
LSKPRFKTGSHPCEASIAILLPVPFRLAVLTNQVAFQRAAARGAAPSNGRSPKADQDLHKQLQKCVPFRGPNIQFSRPFSLFYVRGLRDFALNVLSNGQ